MPPRNGRTRAKDLADNLIKSIEGAEGKEAREVKGTLRDLLEDPAAFTLG